MEYTRKSEGISMNTHTTASDIISNAKAVRARLMGRGRVVNVFPAMMAEIAKRAAAPDEVRPEPEPSKREIAGKARRARHEQRMSRLSEMAALWRSGESMTTIGKAFGVSKSGINYLAKAHRDIFGERPPIIKSAFEKVNKTISAELLLAEPDQRPIPDIIKEVLSYYPLVTFQEVRGNCQNREITAARHHLIWAIRTRREDFSFPMIAVLLKKDQSTIRSAYCSFRDKLRAAS